MSVPTPPSGGRPSDGLSGHRMLPLASSVSSYAVSRGESLRCGGRLEVARGALQIPPGAGRFPVKSRRAACRKNRYNRFCRHSLCSRHRTHTPCQWRSRHNRHNPNGDCKPRGCRGLRLETKIARWIVAVKRLRLFRWCRSCRLARLFTLCQLHQTYRLCRGCHDTAETWWWRGDRVSEDSLRSTGRGREAGWCLSPDWGFEYRQQWSGCRAGDGACLVTEPRPHVGTYFQKAEPGWRRVW